MNQEALEKVKAPATGLLVFGIIGGLFALFSVVMNVLGTGMSAMSMSNFEGDEAGRIASMMSGGLGLVSAIIGLLIAGLIIYGAMKMKELQNYGLAMTAAIVSMVPCVSPCCILGLPIGIWALVILLKPEVKDAFAQVAQNQNPGQEQ